MKTLAIAGSIAVLAVAIFVGTQYYAASTTSLLQKLTPPTPQLLVKQQNNTEQGSPATNNSQQPSAPIIPAATTPPINPDTNPDLTGLFKRVNISVVQITSKVTQTDPNIIINGNPLQGQSERLGSGFVYDAAGHIVTNNHVVDG